MTIMIDWTIWNFLESLNQESNCLARCLIVTGPVSFMTFARLCFDVAGLSSMQNVCMALNCVEKLSFLASIQGEVIVS
jgi:hypothetical protein